MKKTLMFLVLAVFMFSSLGFVMADGNDTNASVMCANSPSSDFCEGGIDYLIIEGYDDDGCVIWACDPPTICEDVCGDNYCAEIVCLSQGCPCAETPESCPQDCDPLTTCDAYWEGYVYNDVTEACELIGASGCDNPFDYETQEACEEAVDEENDEERVCCLITGTDLASEDFLGYEWRSEAECGEKVPGKHCAHQTKAEIKKENGWRLRAGEYYANCEEDCELEEYDKHFRAKFSNGRHALIKIMPDVAAERALERLRLKNCIEAEGCTIELKDVGPRENAEDNETEVVYELKRYRHAKVFGFIKAKMHVKAHVDAQTGEVIKVKKSWWAFLASEPQETEELEENLEE